PPTDRLVVDLGDKELPLVLLVLEELVAALDRLVIDDEPGRPYESDENERSSRDRGEVLLRLLEKLLDRIQGSSCDRLALKIALDVVREVDGALVPPARFFVHRLKTDRLDIERDLRVVVPRREWLLLEDLMVNLHGRLAMEWQLEGEELVENDAES